MALLQNRLKKYHNQRKLWASVNVVENLFKYLLKWYFIALVTSIFFIFNNIPKSIVIDAQGLVYDKAINPTKIFLENSIGYIINFLNFERLYTQNSLLKLENQKLRDLIQDQNITTQTNNQLLNLFNATNFVSETSAKARIVFTSINENQNYAIIATDKNANIKSGDLVLYNKILVGKVIRTGDKYAKILLLTSSSSRVPVTNLTGDFKGILIGNSNNGVILRHYLDSESCKKSEILKTSGDGYIYPRGIPVARVFLGMDQVCSARLLANIDSLDVVEIINSAQFIE
ncbi:MAG: rod shape-determining protein MreC [Rickettsiaceae bacterium]|nr:rod shape-determining protein MreC [Rickettsiaceae bacterium]